MLLWSWSLAKRCNTSCHSFLSIALVCRSLPGSFLCYSGTCKHLVLNQLYRPFFLAKCRTLLLHSARREDFLLCSLIWLRSLQMFLYILNESHLVHRFFSGSHLFSEQMLLLCQHASFQAALPVSIFDCFRCRVVV